MQILSLFLLLRCNGLGMKLTILKSTAEWPVVHLQCCVITTSVDFPNISVTPLSSHSRVSLPRAPATSEASEPHPRLFS